MCQIQVDDEASVEVRNSRKSGAGHYFQCVGPQVGVMANYTWELDRRLLRLYVPWAYNTQEVAWTAKKDVPNEAKTQSPSKPSGAAAIRRMRFTTTFLTGLGFGELAAAHMVSTKVQLWLTRERSEAL